MRCQAECAETLEPAQPTVLAKTQLFEINTVSELALAVRLNSEPVVAEMITPVSKAIGCGCMILKIAGLNLSLKISVCPINLNNVIVRRDAFGNPF